MIEKQLIYKNKHGEVCIVGAYYDRSWRDYKASFTFEELQALFKDLGIKFKVEVHK